MDVLSEKIKNILTEKNLTPSHFADEIGVQRSSISHILSGRNKPSFELIQKIIRRFPDLGITWILDDDISATINKSIAINPVQAIAPGTNSPPALVTQDSNAVLTEKKIEKILIFYTDKTFTEYKPD